MSEKKVKEEKEPKVLTPNKAKALFERMTRTLHAAGWSVFAVIMKHTEESDECSSRFLTHGDKTESARDVAELARAAQEKANRVVALDYLKKHPLEFGPIEPYYGGMQPQYCPPQVQPSPEPFGNLTDGVTTPLMSNRGMREAEPHG